MSLFRQSFNKLLEDKKAAFLKVADDDVSWSAVQNRSQEIFAAGFNPKSSIVLVIGIGGSSLGLRAFVDLAGTSEQQSRLYFLESPDPVACKKLFSKIRTHKKDLHICAVSKSGRTIETLSILSAVIKELSLTNEDLKKQLTTITDPIACPLRDWAKSIGVTNIEMPQAVGGRYSAFTAVGMLPTALLGFDLNGIRSSLSEGVQNADSAKEIFDFCFPNVSKKPVVVFWMYSQRLNALGLWLQQLWAESLGKAKTLDSKAAPMTSSPMVLVGPNDQHSVLQQIMEGQRDKYILFFEDTEAEADSDLVVGKEFSGVEFLHGKSLGQILKTHRIATQRSLLEAGVTSHLVPVVDSTVAPQIFTRLMVLVATLGYALNVDPFDQPGVEAGKKLAKNLLSDS